MTGGPVSLDRLRRPPRLRAGDRVALLAPSGPIAAERVQSGAAWLRSLGLDVVLGRHVLDRDGQGLPFLAGTDADRAGDLQRAWTDPAVRAVFAARGGDGAPRLLDLLDWSALADAGPKVLAGSSDISVLHQAFARRLGLATLYAPMPGTRVLAGPDADDTTRAHLAATLLQPHAAACLEGPATRALVPGRAEGVTVGGCLSLVAACVGTPDQVTAAGGIALLEDLGEAPYRVERLLTQLRRSGWFDGVAGVVCGDWVDCGDPDEVHAVLADRLGDLAVPVLLGLPFGHGRPQLTVPLGVPAELDADAGTLTMQVPALR